MSHTQLQMQTLTNVNYTMKHTKPESQKIRNTHNDPHYSTQNDTSTMIYIQWHTITHNDTYIHTQRHIQRHTNNDTHTMTHTHTHNDTHIHKLTHTITNTQRQSQRHSQSKSRTIKDTHNQSHVQLKTRRHKKEYFWVFNVCVIKYF